MALTFYTNPMSRGRIARVMLEELGEPYETVVLDYGTTMKAPEYLAVNPMGKVPAVVHDGRVVTEVAAICTHLAMAFPEKGLMAEDTATFFRWMFFAAGPWNRPSSTPRSAGCQKARRRGGAPAMAAWKTSRAP